MELYQGQYYHIFNRSNNNEIVFKKPDNYIYFLKKYRSYLHPYLKTLAYCLMPTHFHFFVFIESNQIEQLKNNIGVLLSSYTKAINKRHKRHGSLFQNHTKAILVKDERHLLLVTAYIHQNPVQAKLVKMPEDWIYSSYLDYIGKRKGTLPYTKIVLDYFPKLEDFIEFSLRDISDEDIKKCSPL